MVGLSIPYIPPEAKAVVWRIFGSGESPFSKKSPYDLVETIVRKRAPSTDLDRVIGEMRGWFDSDGRRRWLRSEMTESVAHMILEGVGAERGETAMWAVGSIEAVLAGRIIRSMWSPDAMDSFVESALKALQTLCDRDAVLDANRIVKAGSGRAKIPRDAVERKGRLETFQHLDNRGLDLVHRGLYPVAGNLIELVIDLRPEQFGNLIDKLHHPVVQARAAYHMVAAVRPSDHRGTLQWINGQASDELVALAILHTLNTVNRLDDEIRNSDQLDPEQHQWSTELRPVRDDLDAAATNLLASLVELLAELDPPTGARWIGELLSGAPYILHRRNDGQIPRRIHQLEKACTEQLTDVVGRSRSDDPLRELSAGLCLSPRPTWPRHLAEIAWKIREVAAARAKEIGQVILDEHNRHVAEQLERRTLFLDWNDWEQKEWFSGLGVALVLSRESLDLRSWVNVQCQALPLSVWDAEENYEAFSSADRAVQHWFLVAFHAIPPLKELGRLDPAAVHALVESLWSHCAFAGQFLHSRTEASVVVEHAARYAAEFGAPSDQWILQQARQPGMGPRALWAMMDQRRLKSVREGKTDVQYDDMIAKEVVDVAAERFGDGRQFDLETVRFWGELWLLLRAIDAAEQAAMAIIRFRLRVHDRGYKILVLKLLALVASSRRLAPAIADYPASFYTQLWPGYTPKEERADRHEVDELIERAKFPVL